MMKKPQIRISDYNYELPQERIAIYPLSERSGSKLLFCKVNNEEITHFKFTDIVELIPENALLLMNETKVIAARLPMNKTSGGKAEVLLIEPYENKDVQSIMLERGKSRWQCIIGGKRIKAGDFLHSPVLDLQANVIDKVDNAAIVELSWNEDITLSELLSNFGSVPLPPYIKRRVEDSDKERYQTVYAEKEGSVAAPTAGLHFTDDVINSLKEKGVTVSKVTLHVGPGTFIPVITENISEHNMHAESIIVEADSIDNIINYLKTEENPTIIATGTTTVRTIESLYWIGVKAVKGYKDNELKQWEAYELDDYKITPVQAFEAVKEMLEISGTDKGYFRTSLLIAPPYEYKTIKGIITNFHLPKSTLLLLVAAFTGKELMHKIYEEALSNEYRFLSYGDSSLLMK